MQELSDKFEKHLLVNELSMIGSSISRDKLKCPFHNDHTPSANIYMAESGVWYFRCFTCDITEDVYALRARIQNKPIGEVLNEGENVETVKKDKLFSMAELKSYRGLEDVYFYPDPNTGIMDLIILRLSVGGKKTFRQATPCGTDKFIMKGLKKNPIYNRQKILSEGKVFVVEGEKDVKSLASIGIPATTSPGGSSAAKKADWEPLRGKEIVLWPDNDEPGEKYCKDVVSALEDLDCKISVIDPSGILMDKEDVTDFINNISFHDVTDDQKREEVLDIASSAQRLSYAGDYGKFIREVMSGVYRTIPTGWNYLDTSKITSGGSVTIVCGSPGSAKSFFMIQMMSYMMQQGVKVSIWELEQTREYHLNRAVSQLINNSNYSDMDWLENNPKYVAKVQEDLEDFIEDFGSVIHTTTSKATYTDVTQWIEMKAKQGTKVLCVDPITMIGTGEKIWIEDKNFMSDLGRIVDQHKLRVFLVTHPKNGLIKNFSLDSMAGGSSLNRFSQNVIWIDDAEGGKFCTVKDTHGMPRADTLINKVITVLKGRNSRMIYGRQIGYVFNPNTLKFEEKGALVNG